MPSDKLKKIKDRIAQKSVKPTPKYTAKKSPGKLFGKGFGGNAPSVTTDMNADDGAISVVKAAAFLSGALPESQVKGLIDLSDRIKSTYGHYYQFQSPYKSLLVPASVKHMPTRTDQGHEIPGAKEIVKEIRERSHLATKGYDPDEAEYVAKSLGMTTKSLNSMVDTEGGSTVPPPMLADLIDLQRNLEVFTRAGASQVDLPPNGQVSYPKLTGGSTAYWVAETGSITPSQPSTGSLNLKAKYLAVRVPLTQQLMRFSSVSVEGLVRTDMARQGALKADLAMLEGTGGDEIKGILTYPTASAWTQGVDKLLTYSVTNNVIEPEDIASIHATLPDEVEPTAWIMRRQMWAKIRNRRADAVTAADGKGRFMFDTERSAGDNTPTRLEGTPVVWSSQVSATRGNGSQTYVLTGYFPDWLIARMGVFEFMVDPYTQMQSLQTVIQAVQYIDAGPRHASSFVLADAMNIA